LVSHLDGLVLTAGADIDPSWYGAVRHPKTEQPRPDRDVAEFALMRAALAADLPVLGVCRGLQLLVIEYGGMLHQHLPESHGHSHHCPQVGEPGWHTVTFVPGTRVADVLGAASLVNATDMVTSHHHQGVAHPGDLRVAARADDGLIEAVDDPARRFVVGVQWHPELQDDHRLFAALVAAAEQNVKERLI
jgi:putative glutamine amidotransferase